NLSERRTSDDVPWWTQVGVVEQVEDVGTELETGSCAWLKILDDRQVGVMERRADHDVAAEIAESIHGNEHRCVEPLIHTADDAHRSGHVWTHGIRRAVETAVARDDVDRIAALRLDDCRQLPAAYQRVTGEWQFVCTAEHEPVPGVEVGQPVLIADVVAVLNGKAGGIERVGVERLRPRIGGGELQAA